MHQVRTAVGRIGPLIPQYLRSDRVTAIIPNPHRVDWLTQYEVDFGHNLVQVSTRRNWERLVADFDVKSKACRLSALNMRVRTASSFNFLY
jgi:hypothetical protein